MPARGDGPHGGDPRDAGLLLYCPYDLGRVADDNAITGNVLGDNGSGADQRIVSNDYSGQHNCAGTNLHAITDTNGLADVRFLNGKASRIQTG